MRRFLHFPTHFLAAFGSSTYCLTRAHTILSEKLQELESSHETSERDQELHLTKRRDRSPETQVASLLPKTNVHRLR